MPNVIDPTRISAATTRSRPSLAPLLKGAPEPGREHYWEGELVGSRGSAGGSTIPFKASLLLHGGLIEGTGRAGFERSKTEVDPNFTVTGTLGAGTADFEIWFAGAPLGREPFVCSGTLAADGRAIDGTWSIACVYPGSCDCEGGGGAFRLWRME